MLRFGKDSFFKSFWFGKSLPKTAIISNLGRQIDSGCLVLEGSAGEAACRGGERGRVILPEFEDFAIEHSVKDSARRSEGGGGYGLPPLPPTSDFFFLFVIVFVCRGLWDCGIVGL